MTSEVETEEWGKKARPSQRRDRAVKTEQQLLKTATWLFSERGFHGTGIRDIAVAAGIAISGLYYYASSKDDLLEEIMRRSLHTLTTSARDALAGREDPSMRLAVLIGSHVLFHTNNPRSARVTDHEFRALSGKPRREILSLRDQYESVWSEVIQDGVDAGHFLDRGPVARLGLIQMTTGVAHWYRPRGPMKPEHVWHSFVDMALAMLTPPGQTPKVAADLKLPSPASLLTATRLSSEPTSTPKGA